MVCKRPFAKGVAGGSAVGAGTAASRAPKSDYSGNDRWRCPLRLQRRQCQPDTDLRVANHCHDFRRLASRPGRRDHHHARHEPETFRTGQSSCEVPANCIHAEQVGRGVAYLSGRRRNGGPLSRECFESDLRREGWEIVHSGRKAGFTEDMHAHDSPP